METIYQGALMGIVATIAIDITSLIFKHVLGLPTADWALIGRWVGHVPKGVFVHESIAESAEVSGERQIGWITHYLTGIVYGLIYLGIVRGLLSSEPTLATALAFGLVTLVAPWFILQPGIGVGVFATKAPRPWVTRLTNLFMHTVFGLALYAGWWLMQR